MRTRTPRFAAGPPPLTARQEEVLHLIARGRTNFEIATALGISLEGAKYHVREIMTRLGADSREAAVDAWRRERQEQRFETGMRRWISGALPAGWLLGGSIAVFATVAAIALVLSQRALSNDEAPFALPQAQVSSAGSNIDPSAPASPQVVPSSAQVPEPYLLGTRTGIQVVDRVLDAIEREDGVAIAALISPYELPCTDVPAIAAVACPAGVDAGSPVSVIGSSGGEGSFTPATPERRAALAQAVLLNLDQQDLQFRWDPRLLSIAERAPFQDEPVPGKYLLVFASGHWLSVDDDGITFFSFLPKSPANTAANTPAAFLLPPRTSGAPLTLPEPAEGTIAAGGRVYTIIEDTLFPEDVEFLAMVAMEDPANGLRSITRFTRTSDFFHAADILSATGDPVGRKLTSAVASADGQVIHAAWCRGDDCRKGTGARSKMETEFVRSNNAGLTWASTGTREGEWRVVSIAGGRDAISVRVDTLEDAPDSTILPSSDPLALLGIGEDRFIASPRWSPPAGCSGATCTARGATPVIFDTYMLTASFMPVVTEEHNVYLLPLAFHAIQGIPSPLP